MGIRCVRKCWVFFNHSQLRKVFIHRKAHEHSHLAPVIYLHRFWLAPLTSADMGSEDTIPARIAIPDLNTYAKSRGTYRHECKRHAGVCLSIEDVGVCMYVYMHVYEHMCVHIFMYRCICI